MRTAYVVALVGLIFVCLAPGRALAAEPAITQDELVRRTQELFDSVVPGDQTPWKKYYADDCMYHDEKGRSLGKAKLVADISPMPKGYTGLDQNQERAKPHHRRHGGFDLRFG